MNPDTRDEIVVTESAWYVYILLCADQTLYTGIATDVQRRLAEHNDSDKGARYTRARRPVRLVYQESVEDRSAALRREHEIRRLSRAEKNRLLLRHPYPG